MGSCPVARRPRGWAVAALLAAAGAGNASVPPALPDPDAGLPFSSWLADETSTAHAVASAPDGTLWIAGSPVIRFDPVARRVLSTLRFGSPGVEPVGVVVDGAGCAYVCGNMNTVDFPGFPGPLTGYGGHTDPYVAKIAPDGTTVLWAARFGGTWADVATGIALDAEGNVLVAGTTYSFDSRPATSSRTGPPAIPTPSSRACAPTGRGSCR